MPIIHFPISTRGALIDVSIGLSTPKVEMLKESGESVPNPIIVRGLIDTGASGVCIDPIVVKELGLQPKTQLPMQTPSTNGEAVMCQAFDISFSINLACPPFVTGAVLALEAKLAKMGFQVLIGRDILENCLIVYSGNGSYCTLAY
jgi:hypothetical protein